MDMMDTLVLLQDIDIDQGFARQAALIKNRIVLYLIDRVSIHAEPEYISYTTRIVEVV